MMVMPTIFINTGDNTKKEFKIPYSVCGPCIKDSADVDEKKKQKKKLQY